MLPATPLLPEEIAPWRCTNCKQLMYNRDENGYPVPGAPRPRWWSTAHNMVCRLCYDMAQILNLHPTEYFKTLHLEWMEEERLAKQSKERQTGKRDYYTGL